jgi:hypothetical protein
MVLQRAHGERPQLRTSCGLGSWGCPWGKDIRVMCRPEYRSFRLEGSAAAPQQDVPPGTTWREMARWAQADPFVRLAPEAALPRGNGSPGVMAPVQTSAESLPMPQRPYRAASPSRRSRAQGQEAAAAPLPHRERATRDAGRKRDGGEAQPISTTVPGSLVVAPQRTRSPTLIGRD